MENSRKGYSVDLEAIKPKLIVGIGGSAGALNACKALLIAMPINSGLAFVIISYMNPTTHSHLAKYWLDIRK